jgi:hypothetical protein
MKIEPVVCNIPGPIANVQSISSQFLKFLLELNSGRQYMNNTSLLIRSPYDEYGQPKPQMSIAQLLSE